MISFWCIWMIFLYLATLRMSTSLTSTRCLTDFTNINFRLSWNKSQFGKTHVNYLGHVVGSGELSVDHDKMAAIADWQPPANVKGV